MIAVEPIGHVSVIRLDRAQKRNALTPAMLASLNSAIDRAMSAHAIVVSGVGDIFCAGFDLTLCQNDDGALEAMLCGLSKVIAALRAMPCPVVVSAHGAAVAGGCALLGGADVAVTTADAKLGYPVVRLGISPAVSGPFFTATVGHGAARTRMLDPGLIDGLEAVRIGLVAESLQTPAQCEARAIELAQHFASKPRHALAYTKRWLGELDGTLDASRVEIALAASLGLVGGDEERERLASLWNKKS